MFCGAEKKWLYNTRPAVDYAFGQRKFGGNAQAITKNRWLHHTSLLWDFDPARMQLLKHPAKVLSTEL